MLNPGAREFYLDWEQDTHSKVAHVRAVAKANLDDPGLVELVEELSFKSADFCRMWARHDVCGLARRYRRFRHREVGELNVIGETYNINSVPGQQLLTLQADPGSPAEHTLALLGSRAGMASYRPL